eukprot:2816360-Heterocapsa_arctica.AAC.1
MHQAGEDNFDYNYLKKFAGERPLLSPRGRVEIGKGLSSGSSARLAEAAAARLLPLSSLSLSRASQAQQQRPDAEAFPLHRSMPCGTSPCASDCRRSTDRPSVRSS